jgi:hypothetical protein
VTREQLEHVIRAAAVIADDDELIIVGSQSILGQFPAAPDALRVSVEVDLYPKHHPDRADLIDGSIGELSPFHETYGYYAQGVGPTTAVLPEGWESRLVAVHGPGTRGATGWCLEVHDLLLSKLVPYREKDAQFIRETILHGMARRDVLLERLPTLPVDAALEHLIHQRIDRHFSETGTRE